MPLSLYQQKALLALAENLEGALDARSKPLGLPTARALEAQGLVTITQGTASTTRRGWTKRTYWATATLTDAGWRAAFELGADIAPLFEQRAQECDRLAREWSRDRTVRGRVIPAHPEEADQWRARARDIRARAARITS